VANAVSLSTFFGDTFAVNPGGKSNDALILVTSEKPLLIRTIASIESPSPGPTSCLETGGMSCAPDETEDVSAITDPWAV